MFGKDLHYVLYLCDGCEIKIDDVCSYTLEF